MEIHKAAPACAAVILSGGLNSRMGGRNKAFLEVGGHSIVERLLSRLTPFFSEILLVTRQPERYRDLPARVVTDIYDARSSMTGIHAGLVQAEAGHAFVVPCDAPFLQSAMVRLLLDAWSPQWDVIVPVCDGRYEPLCAIYSKRCIPMIEAQLDRGNYRIYDFFDEVLIKKIPTEALKRADPALISFFNVNTPSAHRTSQKISKKI